MKNLLNLVFSLIIVACIELYFKHDIRLGRILLITILSPIVLCTVCLVACAVFRPGKKAYSVGNLFKEYPEITQNFIYRFPNISLFQTKEFQFVFNRTYLLFERYFSSIISFVVLCQIAFIFDFTPMEYVGVLALSKILYAFMISFVFMLSTMVVGARKTKRSIFSYIFEFIGSIFIVSPLTVALGAAGYIFILLRIKDDLNLQHLTLYALLCVFPMFPKLWRTLIGSCKGGVEGISSAFAKLILPMFIPGFLVVFFVFFGGFLSFLTGLKDVVFYFIIIFASLPYEDIISDWMEENPDLFEKIGKNSSAKENS